MEHVKALIFVEATIVALLVYSVLSDYLVPGISGYLLSGPSMQDISKDCPDCLNEKPVNPEEVGLMTPYVYLALMGVLLGGIVFRKKFVRRDE